MRASGRDGSSGSPSTPITRLGRLFASDFVGHEQLTAFVTPDGTLTPPRLDLDGYLECVQRCRDQFPNLRVISGVELGEAHRHSDVAGKLLGARNP